MKEFTYLIYEENNSVRVARSDGGRDAWTRNRDIPTIEEARLRLLKGRHQVKVLGQETVRGIAEVAVSSFGKL